jgi:hypothetical protein
LIGNKYRDWADWLDVLASAIQKPDSSINILRQSTSFLKSVQSRETDRIATGVEQGRSWQSVLDDESNRIPKGLLGPLSRSVANNQLAETATLLADRLRAQQQFLQECFIAAMYIMVVALVAWIGVLVLVVNLVPSLNVTFELMHEKPTTWLKAINVMYAFRWAWGVAIPVLVIFALVYWLGKYFQSNLLSKDLSKESVQSHNQLERHIMVLKLAVSMMSSQPPVEAVGIASYILLGAESGTDLSMRSQLSGLRGDAATMYLKNMDYWNTQRLEQHRRWLIQKLPLRLTLGAGLIMILAYVFLGLLPWLWILQRSLQEVT